MAIETNSLNFSSAALYNAQRRLQGVTPLSQEEIARKEKTSTASDTSNEQQRSRGFLRQQYESEDRALARLAPIRPTLSPSDEVALFATEVSEQTGQASQVNPSYIAGEATDDKGEAVAVEIITNSSQEQISEQANAQILSLSARQQYTASQLYARNNDVVFNSTPASLLAA